jgi:5-hydroxyisourate hydrolase
MAHVPGLSTHVLDTVRGRPAAGVAVELRDPDVVVASVATDADGRAVLLESGLRAGPYELRFAIGAYFDEDPPFLDVVPIRFNVVDPASHHHVPLLCSPWSYTTYRGS